MGTQSSKTSRETEDERPTAAQTSKEVEERGHEGDDDEEEEEEEEVDEWDQRIFSTGCADENDRMRDCHFEKKDWRLCMEEMEQFKKCWKAHGNQERTGQRDL